MTNAVKQLQAQAREQLSWVASASESRSSTPDASRAMAFGPWNRGENGEACWRNVVSFL